MFRDFVEFTLNGKPARLTGESVFQPLSSYLRYERGLTGTKVVCAEGDCGACTVMARRAGGEFRAINSCIAMTFLMDGMDLVTVEKVPGSFCVSGVSDLGEIQASMIRNFGGQCGFCTPGFVMALTDLYERKDKPTEKQCKNALTGNLCRCTGYQPILQAAMDIDFSKHQRLSKLYPPRTHGEFKPVLIEAGEKMVFLPTDVQAAAKFRQDHPEAVIFSGSTDLGVRFNKGHIRPRRFLGLNLIAEMHQLEIKGDEAVIGARVSLSEVERFFEAKIPEFAQFLEIFASPQIKNSATVAGNLANASPIADTTPLLMSLDAELDVSGTSGARTLKLHEFYQGYKKLALKGDEIITRIRCRLPPAGYVMGNYKISQRRDLDISCVNASFLIHADGEARVSLGGVGPTTLRASRLEDLLKAKKFSRAVVDEVKREIPQLIKPISDARGSADFRVKAVQNLFEKFAREKFGL